MRIWYIWYLWPSRVICGHLWLLLSLYKTCRSFEESYFTVVWLWDQNHIVVKPAGSFGGFTVVWLQDQNCIVVKPAGSFGGFAVVWLQDQNCIVVKPSGVLLWACCCVVVRPKSYCAFISAWSYFELIYKFVHCLEVNFRVFLDWLYFLGSPFASNKQYLVEFGFVCCVDSLNLINIYILSLTQCISFQCSLLRHSLITQYIRTG